MANQRRAALTVQGLRAVELAVQFALAALAARVLGPEEYGLVGVIVAAQMLVSIAVAFGFDELAQRQIARDAEASSAVLATALRARSLAAAAVVLLGVGSAAWFSVAGQPDLAWAIVWAALGAVFGLFSSVYLSLGLATYRTSGPLSASLLSWLVPFAAIAVQITDSVSGYFAWLMVGQLLRLLVSIGWSMRVFGGDSWLIIRKPGRILLGRLSDHVSLVINAMAAQVLARHGDVLVAAAMGVGLGLLGSYSIAFQVTALANTFLMMGIGALGLTRFSAVSEPGTLGLSWRRYSAIAALVSFGPTVTLALLARDLMPTVFGSEYPSLVAITLSLLAAQWVNRIAGGGSNIAALIALDRPRAVGISSLTGAAVNIGLNVLLIPFFGVYGLALATALSAAVVGVWNTVTINRATRARPPLLQYAVLTGFVAAAIACGASEVSLVVRGLISLIVLLVWGLVLARKWRAMT